MTLSHIISNITNQFLPALQYKYVFRNFKQSDLYWSYNPSVVPCYLQGRPKQTILHCLHRQASSNKFVKANVTCVAGHLGEFEVKGKKGLHTVRFGDESHDPQCTCRDWRTYHLPCKHFFAVFQYFPEWDWEKLPKKYLASPYLSSNNQAITDYINSIQQHPTIGDVDNTLQNSHSDNNFDEIPRKVHLKQGGG